MLRVLSSRGENLLEEMGERGERGRSTLHERSKSRERHGRERGREKEREKDGERGKR